MTTRQKLHQLAELSGKEYRTASFVEELLEDCRPSDIVSSVGGTGILAIWKGIEHGKTVCLRAELDALPIAEPNDFEYRSFQKEVSHKCGHDGHMSILLGVAEHLKNNPPQRGNVILLFQPAEETGEGANWMLEDGKMNSLQIDAIYALHNVPHYPLNQIVCREGTFATASTGMVIDLEGKTSHAAEPQNGISPALAVSELIQYLNSLIDNTSTRSFALITIVHALVGELAFGVSPAKGKVAATLRSYLDEDLNLLSNLIEKKVAELAKTHRLDSKISYTETFASTTNQAKCTQVIKESSQELGLDYFQKENPFHWSEDFGQFTQKFGGAMFGLGAGIDSPELHHQDYDFPDKIIQTGVDMFLSIIKKTLQ